MSELLKSCTIWHRSLNNDGYGYRWFRGKMWKAHRVAWVTAFGEIPEGSCVLHKCDNRACVNPDHLFLGSHKQNMEDMASKGRVARGQRHFLSKLTEKAVRSIRIYWAFGFNHSQISRMFGLRPWTVQCIIQRKTWKHV
jgi:hypothetical protein